MPTDNNLPEKLPEPWLNQLREAVKQDTKKVLWLTLLGSSVVASVVTAGANFVLELIKQSNSAQVKRYEVCLDMKKEDLKELRVVYSAVADKFREFETDFSDCIATCEEVLPDNRQTPRDASEALVKVANDLIALESASSDTRVSVDVRTSLAGIIEPTIKQIYATVDNEREIAKVSEIPKFLKWADSEKTRIAQVKTQLETARRGLKIEPCPAE